MKIVRLLYPDVVLPVVTVIVVGVLAWLAFRS